MRRDQLQLAFEETWVKDRLTVLFQRGGDLGIERRDVDHFFLDWLLGLLFLFEVGKRLLLANCRLLLPPHVLLVEMRMDFDLYFALHTLTRTCSGTCLWMICDSSLSMGPSFFTVSSQQMLFPMFEKTKCMFELIRESGYHESLSRYLCSVFFL